MPVGNEPLIRMLTQSGLGQDAAIALVERLPGSPGGSSASPVSGISVSSSNGAVNGSGNINNFAVDVQRGTDITCDGSTFTVQPGVYDLRGACTATGHSAGPLDISITGLSGNTTASLGADVGTVSFTDRAGNNIIFMVLSVETESTFAVTLANDVTAVSWVGLDIMRLGAIADPT